jgi:Methyl-viologen-reducing hydrogenase, delta subunit
LLEQIGLEPARLRMVNLSSAMGRKFAEEAESITAEVKALGLSPLHGDGLTPETLREVSAQEDDGKTIHAE